MSTKKIKVLHLLVTLPVGGAEDLVAAIVRGLDDARFQVQVACIGSPGPVGMELTRAGHQVISLGLDIKHTLGGKIIMAVRRLLQKEKPDILHTHLYHPNLYGRLAALGLDLPVVASVHNSYTRVKFHRQLWNLLLWPLTDRLLVGSSQVEADVRQYDRVPASRVTLLPYGIRMEELDIPDSPTAAKARLGLSGFCLGTIGRLEEQKGQKYLLAALPELRRQIPDLTLLLVGEGRLAAELQTQAQALEVADMVRFLGTRRDLPQLYRAMDIFVLPSLWEGLPLVLLKAMAAGLPVVATRVSGSSEVIKDSENGCLVPPGQPGPLADAILKLYYRPELRQAWGQQARQTIAESYSIQAMLQRLSEIYLSLYSKRQEL
ncbi:MAG: glycosyltransferase [Deltaproteobacteria bacterium]|nr:glycosyltransferase [Deltaproteobacteria bacterium]MBW1952728.1 glycosyltransferase [Deltaproteobacteria bacterium]MBW1986361.1 glycosyltransferase [Deltaproteobacteria bacterium]MBW2133754.1 glycosyltransferase [Deltaproteobacteria bacterium]